MLKCSGCLNKAIMPLKNHWHFNVAYLCSSWCRRNNLLWPPLPCLPSFSGGVYKYPQFPVAAGAWRSSSAVEAGGPAQRWGPCRCNTYASVWVKLTSTMCQKKGDVKMIGSLLNSSRLASRSFSLGSLCLALISSSWLHMMSSCSLGLIGRLLGVRIFLDLGFGWDKSEAWGDVSLWKH